MKFRHLLKKNGIALIGLMSSLIPRDRHIWVTGKTTLFMKGKATPPEFFDNSKYFFLYLHENTDEKVYWLSSSKEEINLLQSMDLPVVEYPSVKAIWLTIRAKYFFHHYGVNQINKFLQLRSTQINLWHGTPLKKIKFDVEKKSKIRDTILYKVYRLLNKVYAASTSSYLSESILSQAFDLPANMFLNYGYPRMDIFGYSPEENLDFCRKYSKNLLPYIQIAKKYDYVIIYMPTFRDGDPDYLEKANIHFEELNERLIENNIVLFLKLHPLTSNVKVDGFSNIIQISNNVDIYPFLSYTDMLITDYSSIYFDYLMLNKEIVFIPYDYETYIANRPLYFDYNSVTPGKKYMSFNDFISDINSIKYLDYSKERKALKDKFIPNYQYDASKQIYDFFRNNESTVLFRGK